MWTTDSSLEQLLDAKVAELNSFEEVLKWSSSIETLLTEDEVKQWRIPLESLDMGAEIGRGAFGVSSFLKYKWIKLEQSGQFASCILFSRLSSRRRWSSDLRNRLIHHATLIQVSSR